MPTLRSTPSRTPLTPSRIPLTPSSISSRTIVSADQFETQPQFEEVIYNTLCDTKDFHELVITNVPLGWEDFLWKVEEELPCTRKSYNPEGRCLRLEIRPTSIHNCVAGWFSISITLAYGSGFLNQEELDLFHPEYGTSEFS